MLASAVNDNRVYFRVFIGGAKQAIRPLPTACDSALTAGFENSFTAILSSKSSVTEAGIPEFFPLSAVSPVLGCLAFFPCIDVACAQFRRATL